MAIYMEERTTPGGRSFLYSEVSGHVPGEEAREMLEKLKQMRKGDSLPNALSIVAPNTKYSAESQRLFTKDFSPHYDRTAAIVSSAVMRAVINFMIRIGGSTKNVRMFPNEQSAIMWLDEPR